MNIKHQAVHSILQNAARTIAELTGENPAAIILAVQFEKAEEAYASFVVAQMPANVALKTLDNLDVKLRAEVRAAKVRLNTVKADA